MKTWKTVRELISGISDVTSWLEWERESLELFHAYARRYGCGAGANVYLFVLRDALRLRHRTLEQFEFEKKIQEERG